MNTHTMSKSSTSSSVNSLSSSASSQEDDFGRYTCGQTLTIKRHIPDPPCGRDYGWPPGLSVPDNISKLEWCLAHPPTPGSTDPNDTRDITLAKSIRTGYDRGAQVFLTNDGLVAKIYDPLYYRFYDRDWPSETIDVATEADHDYTIETAAYIALQGTDVQASIMPQYYGSWTTDIHTELKGQHHLRDVRMILVEHIVGIPMIDIDPFDLSLRARNNIMYRVIEAEMDLRIAGLEHSDYESRNIMLRCAYTEAEACHKSSFEDSNLRVCVIDYGISFVYDVAGLKPLDPGYHNPLFCWPGRNLWCHDGWLPPRVEAVEWMWDMWGCGGKDKKYIKVERNMDDLLHRPVFPQELPHLPK
ncbi:hypothetical protein OPT61_g6046 [Boeremia exigua]|uniref:Uncharacterized protein n=1 Tax=Boeremia exigua TaxID=749465 RepID=A0ACC2I8D6_9PLEO|nr:hypothetical protein OPT61_g6046 [Boeremia exigua]